MHIIYVIAEEYLVYVNSRQFVNVRELSSGRVVANVGNVSLARESHVRAIHIL